MRFVSAVVGSLVACLALSAVPQNPSNADSDGRSQPFTDFFADDFPHVNCFVNPYQASHSARQRCGVKEYPLSRSVRLPDGGRQVTYLVEDSVLTYNIPPRKFTPLRAGARELRRYGLENAVLRAMHQHARARKFLRNIRFVHPRGMIYAVPRWTADQGTAKFFNNWSGFEVTEHAYTEVNGEWIEPGVDSTRCGSAASVVIWTGLGGDTVSRLAQTGTAIGVPGMTNHQYWTEVLPAQDYIIPQDGTAPVGSDVTSITTYAGNNSFFFTMQNYTNYDYLYVNVHADGYNGSTGDVIVERPTRNGSLPPLLDFTNIVFKPLSAYYSGHGGNEFFYDLPRNRITMVGSTNLTQVSAMTASSTFSDKHLACN